MQEWTENLKEVYNDIHYSKDLANLTDKLSERGNMALYESQNGRVVALSDIRQPLKEMEDRINKQEHQDVSLEDTKLWQKQYKNRFTRGYNLSLDINLRESIGHLKVVDTHDDEDWIINSHNRF